MLKVVSYNVFNGKNSKEVEKGINELIKQGVDLFCLQEVRGINNFEKYLIQIIPQGWKMEIFCHERECIHDFGTALLWNNNKLKLINHQCLALSKLEKYNLAEELVDWVLIGHHPPIQRGAMIALFQQGKLKVRVINVHLDWQGGERQRMGQLRQVMDYVHTLPKVDKEIVCGDMNTIGPRTSFQKSRLVIEKILGTNFLNAFTELKPTTNSMLKQELDHFYYNGWKLQEQKIITEMKGSDHFPLYVGLEDESTKNDSERK